jgi:hypothetical protein
VRLAPILANATAAHRRLLDDPAIERDRSPGRPSAMRTEESDRIDDVPA